MKTYRSDFKVYRPLKPKTGLKQKVRKITGELELFLSIWNERPHKCEVTGEPIYVFDVWNFSHVVPKSRGENFRLMKENIMLVTKEFHNCYDRDPKEIVLNKYPNARFVYAKYDKLNTKK